MEVPITINLSITLTESADPQVRQSVMDLVSSLRQLGNELVVNEEVSRFISEDDSVTQETILEFLNARDESDPKGRPKLADNSMGNLLHRIPKKRLRIACRRCGRESAHCKCSGHGYLSDGVWYLRRLDACPREWEISKADLLDLTADDLERVHHLVRPRTIAFIEWLREQ